MSDPSGQDDWAHLVKEAHKEKKEQHELPPPLPPGMRREKRSVVLPVLLAVSVLAVVLHLQGSLNPWPPGPTVAEAAAGQLVAMNLAAKAIHDYAAYHGGKYPAKLQDVMPLTVSIRYVPTADGFELHSTGADGKPIVVKSK